MIVVVVQWVDSLENSCFPIWLLSMDFEKFAMCRKWLHGSINQPLVNVNVQFYTKYEHLFNLSNRLKPLSRCRMKHIELIITLELQRATVALCLGFGLFLNRQLDGRSHSSAPVSLRLNELVELWQRILVDFKSPVGKSCLWHFDNAALLLTLW